MNESDKHFAVIHVHDRDGDDFLFTSELRSTPYSIASVFSANPSEPMTGLITRNNFGSYEPISPYIFSAMCDDLQSDDHITCIAEFDLEGGTLGIRKPSDDWRVYELTDVTAAVQRAESIRGLSITAREEIFNAMLDGKEIDLSRGPDFEENEDPITQTQM